jgi:hypothetical protein
LVPPDPAWFVATGWAGGGGAATGREGGAARTAAGARGRLAWTETVGSASDFCSVCAGAPPEGVCCVDGFCAGALCCGAGVGACSVVF